MITRRRAALLAEVIAVVNANDPPEPELAKVPNRDQEHASVTPEFREKSTKAPFVVGMALQHADSYMHEDVSTLQLKYVTYARPSYSVDLEDTETGKETQPAAEDEERYDGKPAEEFPDWPYVISEAAAELATKYSFECTKRDQDVFDMYIKNDFTGEGIQEVIENQLTGINTAMAKRQLPADEVAFGLWIRLSAFAHWTQSQELGPWFMMADSQRLEDTVAMIGIAILATLNALDRAKLLMEHSPVKDLGLVLALLGDFICECLDQTMTIPYLSSNDREVCWPYKIVSYAKASGIEIKGVHDIEKKFVKRFDNEDEANHWKRKECVDRWGWGTKWRILCKEYGVRRSILHHGPPLGGKFFDITCCPAADRMKYHFEGKDPLDPQNPLVQLEWTDCEIYRTNM
ncbi:SAP domain-containing isoform 2 [Pyrenophora seminiperda CCB06]|uniref:SAP domain-containing isoform 2 n=1 Tax=Pyrenophora seminiperda CCB06 TaxID=1302712 RepID=A0A3M7MFZ3_9PLEO|nr:SAP domain-containing isoform 2 [Pyrenophora seminiperda CCB06]